jgi:hypothetical protein
LDFRLQSKIQNRKSKIPLMSSPQPNITLTPEIRALLSGLRWRIRGYIVLYGAALAIIWLGLTFWIALALDYFPVVVGATEMPVAPRALILAGIAAILAFILIRWVLLRVFVPLGDRSMAVLLERRYRQFHDSLVTAVEMSHRPEHASEFNQAMLAHSFAQAQAGAAGVRIGRVFRLWPLVAAGGIAVAVMSSIALFAALSHDTFLLGAGRLYLLRNDSWPRRAEIRVAGLELSFPADASGQAPPARLLKFTDGPVKVAQGSNLTVIVEASAKPGKVVPETCSINYRTAEGDRGRVSMRRIGGVQNGRQEYRFDGKPFRGVLSSLEFDVRGRDHRVRGYEINVVDSPAITKVTLDCVFPEYLVEPGLPAWRPRSMELTGGVQLPRGTKIRAKASTNKPLREAQVVNVVTKKAIPVEIVATNEKGGAGGFTFEIDSLDENLVLDARLHDADGVISDRPHRLAIPVVEDGPPVVDVALRGIGTAVTPDVRIPVRGEVRDDYAVAKVWFELETQSGVGKQRPIDLVSGAKIDAAVDFREERARQGAGMEIKPQDKLHLAVKAADRFNLSGGPNVGTGDRYQLDVVTPDELRRMLEVRELSLRGRLEQIHEEISRTRDSLMAIGAESSDAGEEPEDAREGDVSYSTPIEGSGADAASANDWSRPQRRVEDALLQSEKSAGEVLGVSVQFEDIRLELENNRVDSEDRKRQLSEQIAIPLAQVAQAEFPRFDERLKGLLSALAAAEGQTAAPAIPEKERDAALEQADVILARINEVLDHLIKLESYNELLDIVRSLIEQQEELRQLTEKQRKQQALELLE